MSSIITVQLDALEVLAGELTALARELADDSERCRGAAGQLRAGLSSHEGLSATWGASTWATVTRALADGTQAVAGSLGAAVTAYAVAERVRVHAMTRSGSEPAVEVR